MPRPRRRTRRATVSRRSWPEAAWPSYLTSEQVKCLSQLGQFRGERTWEAHCDPNEFEEAVDLLKQAGIEDVFMHFGN
jgi:hypothetical protein